MSQNALMQQTAARTSPQQQQGPSPEEVMLEEFTKRAAAAGIDLNKEIQSSGDVNGALERAMQQIWKQQPTDENAEMIDMLSQRLGIQPPWAQQQQQPQQQGQQPGQPGMAPQQVNPQNMMLAPRR